MRVAARVPFGGLGAGGLVCEGLLGVHGRASKGGRARVVRRSVTPHRPKDATHAASEGNGSNAGAASFRNAVTPFRQGIVFAALRANQAPGCLHEQPAKVRVAMLGDVSEPLFIAPAGVFAWNETEVSRDLVAVAETTCVVDDGNERACDKDADARHRG